MSYDVIISEFDGNYTANMADLFYDHLEGGIQSLDGMTGDEAAHCLAGFWKGLNTTYIRESNTGMQAKYDSPNGWGSTVGALIFIGQLSTACALNPKERVSVSA